MTGFMIALMAGFAGSFHCVGMCGGFACGLAQIRTRSRIGLAFHSLLYNTGRLVTYAFIGALSGAFGAALIGVDANAGHAVSHGPEAMPMGMILSGDIGIAQRFLSAAAGILMLFMALELLGFRRHVPKSWVRLGGEAFAGIFRTLLLSGNPVAPLALGVANGFLPCPLVFAFAATAAATGAVEPAVLTMTAFGLGTFPAMMFMSAIGGFMPQAVQVWGVRAAGTFVLVIGLVTLIRGVLPGLLHMGGHAMTTT